MSDRVACGHRRWNNTPHCAVMECPNYVSKHVDPGDENALVHIPSGSIVTRFVVEKHVQINRAWMVANDTSAALEVPAEVFGPIVGPEAPEGRSLWTFTGINIGESVTQKRGLIAPSTVHAEFKLLGDVTPEIAALLPD